MKILSKITATALVLSAVVILSSCQKDDTEPPSTNNDGVTNPYGAGNGAVSFSCTASAAYIMSIALNGIALGQLNQYFNSVPECGQSSNGAIITVIRPTGTYTWCGTLGNGTNYGGSVTITEGQCTSVAIQSMHAGGCGGAGGNGVVTFYQQANGGHGPITITVDGQNVGTLTTYHPTGPTCGSGQVNVPRSQGLHTWEALAQDGYHYEGSITWPSNGGCSIQQVESLLSPPANSFDGWTFWTPNSGHGTITIYVDGIDKGQITNWSNNAPTCGQGDVNVQMPAGSHWWSAQAADGTYWGTYFSPPDLIGNPTYITFDDDCHSMSLN